MTTTGSGSGSASSSTTINTTQADEAVSVSTELIEAYGAAVIGVTTGVGLADNALGRFARTMTGTITQAMRTAIDSNAEVSKSLRGLTANYRSFNEGIGGLTNFMLASEKPLDTFAAKSLDTINSMQRAVAGMGEEQVTYVNAFGKTVNAFDDLYKDPKEAMKDMIDISNELVKTNSRALLSVESNKGAMNTITQLVKTSAFEIQDANAILQRQYAYTGEASDEVLQQIVANSVAVGQATGVPLKQVQSLTVQIMSDTKTFGDIGVDSAARISGALSQLGLDFQTFQNMTSNFMNFEDAASKMGDLSAMFGIQMDAMEMTYLANEDQEEFMHRFREEILDAGLDVENMSKSRQRMLASQLGLSIEQMRTFMREGELAVGEEAMMGATETAKGMDGAQEAMEKFADTTAGAMRTATEMVEAEMLGMSTYSVNEFAKAEASAVQFANTIQDIEYNTDQIQHYQNINHEFLGGLIKYQKQYADLQKALIQGGVNSVDLVGGTVDISHITGIPAGQRVAVATGPARGRATSGIGQNVSPVSSATQSTSTTQTVQPSVANNPTGAPTPIPTGVPQITTAINQNNVVVGELKDMFSKLHDKYDELLDKMKNISDKEMTFKLEVDGQGLGQAMVNRFSRGNITANDGRSFVLAGGEQQ